ncbi:hypothetical protein ES703_48885 [subsurface metagenome]
MVSLHEVQEYGRSWSNARKRIRQGGRGAELGLSVPLSLYIYYTDRQLHNSLFY